jgi:hypothetical protein
MSADRLVGLQARLAVVTSVDHANGVAQTRWMDDDETGPSIPVPHPFSGRGEGIYVGLRQGSLVALVRASYGRYIPVAVVPMRGLFASDLSDIPEMAFDDIGVPLVDDGEVVVQGPTGAVFRLNADGSVALRNGLGEGWMVGGDQDEAHRCAIERPTAVKYTVSQAGLDACGLVRRDVRPNEDSLDASIFDPMFDLEAEQLLEEVGRDPTKDVTHGTRKASGGSNTAAAPAFRNPPFVERRNTLYEFGTGWNVGTPQDERDLLDKGELPTRIPSYRRERRSNILSLSLSFPNELMESVDGTLVDVFGNLLDINRSIIPPPSGGDSASLLESLQENARHTVALHREINTRKGWAYTGYSIPDLVTPDVGDSSNNSRDRSRWFIDVDKEGLTKINIPASSETGNVPCLVRYETSSVVDVDNNGKAGHGARSGIDDPKRLFRSDLGAGHQRQDIFLDQFGPGGIALKRVESRSSQAVDLSPDNRLADSPTGYVEGKSADLPAKIQGGTAFHSIVQTAAKLLGTSMNQVSYDAVNKDAEPPEEDGYALNLQVIQSFLASAGEPVSLDDAGRPENYPNAGGRSLHANLDGSVELSVGANTIDRLSWVMDTAGGIVARIGRDRYGRSAVVQMDGSLAMEIGGYDFVGPSAEIAFADRRFSDRVKTLKKDPNIFRAGKVVIRVRRANTAGTGPDADKDNLDQVIIIDEKGVSVQATGQLSLKSTMDMVLQSGGKIVLDGKDVVFYTGSQQRSVLRQGGRRQI